MSRDVERRVGEVGVPLQIKVESSPSVAKDISGATTLTIYLYAPGASSAVVRTAGFVTDGTDGLYQALTEAGDLSVEGLYKYYGQHQTATETKKSGWFTFWVIDPDA